ncbi:hypothetical protein GCM10009547_10490 [Sporichthya brevicatena]|uniref:Secreted protein n=1 Tax=Sporichthya brevicatena TaxID=171442 RepID=A0ABN1GFF0_9ACTN
MTTSLASSPVLPIVMAGAAGLLVVGTFSSSATPNSQSQDSSPPAAQPALPTGANIPATCKGKACTIAFPKVGDYSSAFGQTVTLEQIYTDGAAVTVGATRIVSSLKVTNKDGGYALKIVKVAPTGVTVRVTQS